MWKILIADDEPKIRRGLRSLIEQMGLPVQVTGEAGDGETALEVAGQTQPDILLVDINMPFLDGLAFIGKLRETRQDARIIVVTGYEEFEYARQALTLEVQDYLLKPVVEEELRAALESAIAALSATVSRTRHYEWAMRQLAQRREELLEQFFRDIISGQLTEEEIDRQLPYFEIPGMRRVLLVMIASQGGNVMDEPWSTLIQQLTFADALADTLRDRGNPLLFSDERGHMLLLSDVDREEEAALKASIQHALLEELGARATVLAQEAASIGKLGEAYDTLLTQALQLNAYSSAVQAARRYINEHYPQIDLGLEEVAQHAGIHPSYLSRLMKQELGMSFAKYLTTTRINKAIQLMQDEGIRIKTIAEQVGYATPHYFSTAFKKVLGVSPAEYRSEEKGR